MLNVIELRRHYQKDVADELKAGKRPQGRRFFESLKEGFDSRQIRPDELSTRSLMENFIFDESGKPCGHEIVQSWNPTHGGGSDGLSLTKLMEDGSVMASAFSSIQGQIVFNATLQAYESEDFVFTKEIPMVQTQFSGERIPGIGGIGDKAEIVGEGQIYPMVGVTEDFIDTPVTTKRGLILPLTKEAAFFDRTGLLLARCAEVGLYLGVNKEKRAIDCFIDENTTAHRYNRKLKGPVATYGDNAGSHDWDNLQATNALANYTNVDNVDQLLYAILDPNTGEPIQITGQMKLVVARGLLKTAEAIQHASQVVNTGSFAVTGNPIQTWSGNITPPFTILSSRMLATRMATLTSWYYGAPSQAMKYMQNWPMTTVEAPSNSELEFTQDIVMRWKASERGQYAVTDPRYVAKSTA